MQRLWPSAALLLLFGCSGSVTNTPCKTDADCTDGVCTPEGICGPASDAGGDGITFTDGGDGSSCPSGVVCGGICCASGQVCEQGACVPAASCSDDTECSDDTYCDGGKCIPWGTGPKGDKNEACTVLVPIGLFSPTQQCSWTGPPAGDAHPNHRNVLGTPVVVDFDFDGDPTVKQPSIVFVSYDGTDGGGAASQCDGGYFGVIRVIDGATCAQQHSVAMTPVRPSSPLAVADIDLDGRPDIVASRCGGGLAAFGYEAPSTSFKSLWTSAAYGATGGGWSGPAIHDLDDDGTPEILLWGTVWSNTGALLDGVLGQLPYGSGSFAVAADLDGDGKIELANGAFVWRWSGGQWAQVHATGQPVGHVAVADFGTFGSDPTQDDRGQLDGVAEVAVVSSGNVRVQTIAGRVILGPVAIPSGGTGGPPTIGDFDNDGRAEVAAAGSDSYTVFDPDCVGAPQKANCDSLASNGVLWSKVSQDHSSSVTGSSVFDFEGDGAAEAVYADECFTRVYDGKTGEVLYSQWRSSCTWNENPIVADVDGDFNSELVVPSNTNCDTDCTTNPNHDKHPTTGKTLDPLFKGLRCKAAADCLSGVCDAGFCRCTGDADCGGGGFVCGPPKSSAGSGQVCRAAYNGKVGGILVYRDVLDRWVNSRMIWNQHTYAVTHINEDGTVPKSSAWAQNWKKPGLNNFRQNVQGDRDPTSSPDLTAKKLSSQSCDAEFNMSLKIKLCNRGTQPVGQGIPVTFYKGPPAAGQPICTATSSSQLDPGQCVELSCVWAGAPTSEPVDVHVVADDDGSGKGTTSECVEGNNSTVIEGVLCNKIG